MTDDGDGQRWSRGRIAVWATAALIMAVPLLAMQVTDQVLWDATDFAVFGALLVGAGVAHIGLAVSESGG
jgi:hypothetical protein